MNEVRDYIYIVNLVPKFQNPSSWTDKENRIIEDHFERLKRQHKRGTVKYVGKTDLPVDNPNNFGMVVFEAENDTMAELFAQADPAVMAGMMTVKCLPFKHVL
ncbi:MAG: hypothetical protein EP314_02490 [Bacteroidetes bacterium]|nr:MAG: hypothetical protein EP314_02490 [Bacteroidota bacterium]